MPSQENREHRPHKVYSKLNWSNNWVEEENLFADQVVFSCAPDISKATLHWRYGRVMGFGKTAFETRARKDLLDYYIKVEIERPDDDEGGAQDFLNWYGVVVSDSRELDGRRMVDGVRIGAGTQTITCLGLEYLLTRKVIDTSVVATAEGGEKIIRRAIGFNLGAGHDNSNLYLPNKDSFVGGKGTAIFDDRLDDSNLWASSSILEYLLAYHSPTNEAGEVDLQWQVASDSNWSHLDWHKPMLRVHGHSLFDVLNMLIDRRRLSSWKVVISENKPCIYVFTFNPDDVILPDGKTILGSPLVATWNFDTDKLVMQPTLTRDATSEFAKVICRGERRGFCFTLAYTEGAVYSTLEPDWAAALETTYDTGASVNADYAAAEETEKQDKNKAYRNLEQFKRVYKYFRIPPAWNGTVSSGTQYVFPKTEGTPILSEQFWIPGFRFESFIPLKTDITYGDTIVAEDMSVTTGDTLAKSKKEYRRPLVVIDTAESGTAKYEDITALSRGDSTVAYHSNGRDWSCSVRMADDAPSIIIDVQGAPQHVIAFDEFIAPDNADKAEWPPELRWQTIFATIFMHGDCYAEQSWPDLPVHTTDDVSKVLIIDVPNMRLDYVAPSTVVSLNTDGSLKRTANGGYIYDDREKLKEIARVAYEWYSTPRQSFDAAEHTFNVFEVGDLIETIGTGTTLETVNSVVTQLAIDLRRGVASYKTAFGELDFSRLLQ